MERPDPATLRPAGHSMRELARTLGAMEGALCNAISLAERADSLVRDLEHQEHTGDMDRSLAPALRIWADAGSELATVRHLTEHVRDIWNLIYPYYGVYV